MAIRSSEGISCVICGAVWKSKYFNKPQPICYDHWRAVPPKLRRDWWVDIDYGKRPPSPEMIQTMKEFFTTDAGTNP